MGRNSGEKRKLVKDLGLGESMAKIQRFSGSLLTAVVGDERFKLSKNLLCYHYTFFYKIFNGNFKEGIEQTVTLETRAANFQMVIQWMHTSAISLPTSTVAEGKKITPFLEFLVHADQIVCLGHLIASLHRRKLSLSSITNTSLLSMSVQPLLPRSHPTRKLFAQSWLGPCLSYIHPGEGYTRSLFSSVQKKIRFEKDLKEPEEFAPELV